MASPCAGKFVGAFFSHQVVAPKSGRHFLLRHILTPGEIRRLVLGVVLQEREQHTNLQIFIWKLIHFGYAMSYQDRIVGDSFKKSGGSRIHRQHRGLEPDQAAHVQILQISESSYMPRYNLVADELLELRK